MPEQFERFTFSERMAHWMAALSFVYAALTGLALWSYSLYWLAGVFGGGPAVRWGHPWGGTAFALVLTFIFKKWARQMRLTAEDRTWIRKAHQYAIHNHHVLPEAGRFNGGQKMLFWLQSVSTLVLLASGVVLWWPEWMPRPLLTAAILAHPCAAVAAIAGIILHIYMGTAAVPGALRAMVRGVVSSQWAASHHPKWYREISKR
ncbi:MAG: formate dehydrogenase subunit gamma [Acidobacteriota bacterium]